VSSVQFFLDGKALGAPVKSPPYAISWDTTTAGAGSHVLTASATDPSGNVGQSAQVSVKVENPLTELPCFVIDVNSTGQGHNTVTAPACTTAEAGEQLVAFVSSDGPKGAGKQASTVSGAGLTWSLVARATSRSGDAEIWAAKASTQLVGASVTATQKVTGY